MTRWLTPERRDLAANTMLGAAALTVGVLATVWLLAAVVVGSVAIGRWIGAMG